jgi:glyoxylase-like metal-dependent hydrolase (beta-lactamase superfamily II)
VYPTEPFADPLAEWLESLDTLKSRISADVLVLPAHGKPFRGAHERLDALIAEHVDCLDKLELTCKDPRRAVDVFPALFKSKVVFPALFKSKVSKHKLILATGESVAHLNYLINQDRMTVERDEDGVNWYRSQR